MKKINISIFINLSKKNADVVLERLLQAGRQYNINFQLLKDMVKNEDCTAIRVSKYARFIIKRMAKLQGRSITEFLEKLAMTLDAGVSCLGDKNVSDHDLRALHPRADIIVVEDFYAIFSPVKKGT